MTRGEWSPGQGRSTRATIAAARRGGHHAEISSLGEDGALRIGRGCGWSETRSSAGGHSLDLALKNTYVKGRSDPFNVSPSWTSIFSPTAIMCPGSSGTCSARIEVSVRFFINHSFDFYDVVHCRVIRGGILAPTVALPGDVELGVQRGSTFAWIAPGLPLGSSTINVQCTTLGSVPVPIRAVERTLTIDVYKP